MLKAAIIRPDRSLRDQLETRLSRTGRVKVLQSFDQYPDHPELTRFVRSRAPEVVFISMEELDKTLAIVKWLEIDLPGIQTVAIQRDSNQHGLLETIRAGVRDCVSLPFDATEVEQVLKRVSANLAKNPVSSDWTGKIYSFLPSKPGAGTSTVAVNTSTALSNILDERVLLADFDLSSRILRFTLMLTQPNSLKEAAEWAFEVDESVWPRLISQIGNLDVLHAGPIGHPFQITAPQMRHMAEFWNRTYGAVCVDLSGDLNQHSLEVMHESKQIFLVTTPETASVHQAKEKFAYLRSIDLGDRVKLIVNRYTKSALMAPTDIERLVGAPLFATLGNDYDCVQKALQAATAVSPSSVLGKQFAELAASIAGKPKADSEASGKPRLAWLKWRESSGLRSPGTAQA